MKKPTGILSLVFIYLALSAGPVWSWCWIRDTGVAVCPEGLYQQNCCEGHLRRWPEKTMECRISNSTEDRHLPAVRAAFQNWNGIEMCGFTFTEGPRTDSWEAARDDENLINIDRDFCDHYPYYCGSGVKGFSGCFTQGAGTDQYRSIECDVVLNASDWEWGDGQEDTLNTVAVVTHELGHNMGLTHPGDACRQAGSSGCGSEFPEATMYWRYADGQPTNKENLELDDLASAVYGYPVSQVRVRVLDGSQVPVMAAEIEVRNTVAPVSGSDIASGGTVAGDVDNPDVLSGNQASSTTYIQASPFQPTDQEGYTNYIQPLHRTFQVSIKVGGQTVLTEEIMCRMVNTPLHFSWTQVPPPAAPAVGLISADASCRPFSSNHQGGCR